MRPCDEKADSSCRENNIYVLQSAKLKVNVDKEKMLCEFGQSSSFIEAAVGLITKSIQLRMVY
jgi:hypothetical protein